MKYTKLSIKRAKNWLVLVFKWAFLGLLTGMIGGLLGAGFHYSLRFVTGLRAACPLLIFLLPAGAVATVAIYRLCRLQDNRGTNEVIDAVLQDKPVHPLIAPIIWISAAITHFLGGSAGREGAALQIGGSVASLISHGLKLKDADRRVLIICGMGAVFSGLFGTPLAACFFVMEFESVGSIFTPALLPCFLACFTASRLSLLLGVHPEGAALSLFNLNGDLAWRIMLLAVLIAVLGLLMCRLFHGAEHLAKKILPNPWLRALLLSLPVVVLTLLVGDQRYNGAGMEMALAAVGGHADWYDFLLKLLFTAITLAAGFKGGEIVPTFCIGACFGCVVGAFLGLDPALSGALGLVGLFCSVTNSPIASIFLSVEMFGGGNIYLFAIVCVVSFVLSGHSGLYASQILRFDKVLRRAGRSKEE